MQSLFLSSCYMELSYSSACRAASQVWPLRFKISAYWCWKTHPVLDQCLCKGQNRWTPVGVGYSASSWSPLRANLLTGLPQDRGSPALHTSGQCWVGTVNKFFLNRQQPTHSSPAFSVHFRFSCGDTGVIYLIAPDFAHDSAESHLSI